jgi:hypothetical protein
MFDWQTMIALVVVAAAACMLLRHALGFLRSGGQKGCAACPSRSQSTGGKSLPLVQLQGPKRSSSP